MADLGRADHWVTIREAADLLESSRPAGMRRMSISQTRRRLGFIDRQARDRGASGILKRFGPHCTMVSAEALLRELRTDPNLHEARTSELESRVEDLTQKLQALRNVVRSMKHAAKQR